MPLVLFVAAAATTDVFVTITVRTVVVDMIARDVTAGCLANVLTVTVSC